MEDKLRGFIDSANTLFSILTEYKEATDRILDVDLAQDELSFAIDDIENIVGEREEIRERLQLAQEDMAEKLDGDFNEVKQLEIVVKLLGLQGEIVEKDKQIMSTFSSKQSEVKSELKSLQDDKKKLDFLNVTAGAPQESKEFNV